MRSLFDTVTQRIVVPTVDGANTTQTQGTYVDARLYTGPMCFVFQVTGAVHGGAIELLDLRQATASDGTGAKVVNTGKLLDSAAFIAAFGATVGDVAAIEMDVGELDVENSFWWVAPSYKFSDVTGTNNITCLFTGNPIHKSRTINGVAATVTKDAA